MSNYPDLSVFDDAKDLRDACRTVSYKAQEHIKTKLMSGTLEGEQGIKAHVLYNESQLLANLTEAYNSALDSFMMKTGNEHKRCIKRRDTLIELIYPVYEELVKYLESEGVDYLSN